MEGFFFLIQSVSFDIFFFKVMIECECKAISSL